MKFKAIALLLVVLSIACAKKRTGTDDTAAVLDTDTDTGTEVPTTLSTSGAEGEWNYYDAPGHLLWTMTVTATGTAVVGTVFRDLWSLGITAEQRYQMTDAGGGALAGTLTNTYSHGCTDTLNVAWTNASTSTMTIALSCSSCACGIIQPHFSGSYPVYR